MKTAKKTTKITAPAAPEIPQVATPIQITTGEGERIRRIAEASGSSVADIVRASIIDGLEKLERIDATAIPCPFCQQSDRLEVLNWTDEARDGSEYNGEAIRCNRCFSVTAMAPWMRWALRQPSH